MFTFCVLRIRIDLLIRFRSIRKPFRTFSSHFWFPFKTGFVFNFFDYKSVGWIFGSFIIHFYFDFDLFCLPINLSCRKITYLKYVELLRRELVLQLINYWNWHSFEAFIRLKDLTFGDFLKENLRQFFCSCRILWTKYLFNFW